MCENPSSVFGGGGAVRGEVAVRKMVMPLSPSVWRGFRICGWAFFRNDFAQLCVRFCGWAWCVRLGHFRHGGFFHGTLAAKASGVLVDALLGRLAVERRGRGRGVGCAIGIHTCLQCGLAECASHWPAFRAGRCVCAWLGGKRLLEAPVRSLWWQITNRARPHAA